MKNAIKSIENFLTYKAPVNIEGFELLEKAQENADQAGQVRQPVQSAQTDQARQAGQKNSTGNEGVPEGQKGLKKPFSVNKWNVRRSDRHGENGGTDEVSISLDENLQMLKNEFKLPANDDIYIREFRISGGIRAAAAYIEGMADRTVVNDFILRPVMESGRLEDVKEGFAVDVICNYVLTVNNVRKTSNFINDVVTNMLNGFTVLFVDGCGECILIESRGYEKRSVGKPTTENVIKGAQEAFTENLRTNITLIRRIVKNKDLITEIIPVRSTNNFSCAVLFIDGITNPELINEMKRRINSINTDIISSDGMLEQLIEDRPFTLFPQMLSTERPDRAASFLLDGQVVIVSEGSPFVMAAPVTVFHLYHTSEDANLKWQFATALRLIRILGILSSALLPGLYIALTLYHREMIPTELLVSIARAKESIPFPGLVEVVIMEVSFEVIREAGIRVPGVIGPTLGIIGALVLGQAAVAANLVSPVLIIIVAVTGLGNFAVPNYSFATSIRVLRFLFIFIGCIAGFYGIAACLSIIMANMCNLKSFGVPFLSPVAPQTGKSSDLFVRKPIWQQKERPDYLNTADSKRQPDNARGWRKGREK